MQQGTEPWFVTNSLLGIIIATCRASLRAIAMMAPQVGPGCGGVLHNARKHELGLQIEAALFDHPLDQRIAIAAGKAAAID